MVQPTQEPDDNNDGDDGTPDDEECPEGRKRHPVTKGCYPAPKPTPDNSDDDNSGGGTPSTPCAAGTYPSAAVEQNDNPSVYYGQVSKKWKLIEAGNELNVRAEGNLPRPAEWVQVGDTGCYALAFNTYGVDDPCAPANVLGTLASALGTSAAVVKWLKGIAAAVKTVATLSPLGAYLGVCAIADVAKYIQENHIDSDDDSSDNASDDNASDDDSSDDDSSDNASDDDSSDDASDDASDDDNSRTDTSSTDNSSTDNSGDSSDSGSPTENGDVSNSQLRDAFSDGYWFFYENGPGCTVLGAGRSTDRIVYKCPE